MKAVAIIGAMYGDEGKGLMTDYICHQLQKSEGRNGLVVRFQGGAQSGHTVVTPEGKRHIFSHFGSGTLLGVPTVLGPKFVCNPHIFVKEYEELKNLYPSITPIFVDIRCYVTTPYDVVLNQEIEKSRGDNRHGSVGVGFGETIEREEVGGVRLTFNDLFMRSNDLVNRLDDIRSYFFKRMGYLGLDYPYWAESHQIIPKFLDEIKVFRTLAIPFAFDINKSSDFIVFEGGQGLGLDMEFGQFPHVTRSRTGTIHAQEFCDEHDIELDEVIYVSRAYITRHGAGPLEGEVDLLGYINLNDETNTQNEYQGKLRLAPFDFELIAGNMAKDMGDHNSNASLAITCMDQICKEGSGPDESLASYASYGPTRNDVKQIG